MAVYVAPPAQWGEVLQQPNIGTYSGTDAARQQWMQRQSEMSTAQQAALAQLTTALGAGRDKTMADQAATDAYNKALADLKAKGSGGGGGGGGRKGGGGGGGSTGMMVPASPDAQSSWLDQYLASLPSDAAPTAAPLNTWNVTGQGAWQVPHPPSPVTSHPVPTPVSGTGINTSGSRSYSVAHPMGVGILPKPVIQLEPSTPTRYAPSRLS